MGEAKDMKKFEYTDASIKSPVSPEERQKLLSAMGDEGWELVQIMQGQDGYYTQYYYFFFKREKLDD